MEQFEHEAHERPEHKDRLLAAARRVATATSDMIDATRVSVSPLIFNPTRPLFSSKLLHFPTCLFNLSSRILDRNANRVLRKRNPRWHCETLPNAL